ncbi:uncharacterized protein Tco025E_06963 [Trypanosoma conorhini]|uniref:Uncharacterized protein n=1 Tax=Trypanosoma conorhini TaxID=83891 RepID=A0A3R7L819_9TRYP|nr:uncharacterized protein Tco025E_06963 [Trypanosoma conorhini]RNF09537.1 hypothetical protein Tco025E_06963 [Trypanosoma conorhini]
MLDMSIEVMTELATEVLTSPDKEVRERAAGRLRFLNSFDYWERVKGLLPQCQNNYLRFILCKAMHFIVSNELGPQERKDIQVYVMDYLKAAQDRGEELPVYVKNELYSIYASALHINWRLTVFDEKEKPRGVGLCVVEALSARLPASDVLDFLLEVLTYFAKQEIITCVEKARLAFVNDILPSFFSFSVGQISSCGPRALEVCCTILQVLSTLTPASLITVQGKTDEPIFMGRATSWFPALSLAVQDCSRAILANPTLEASGQCARLLRMASAVDCRSEDGASISLGLGDSFLELSANLLSLYNSTGLSHILQLGCALLVNAFEREKSQGAKYLHSHPFLIERWAEAVSGVLVRWEEDEEELRQELMHLFFTFGDCADLYAALCSDKDEVARLLVNSVTRVSQCYFDNVVAKAHLTEDSYEIRSDMGVMLHNEKTLLPIAEMLFCREIDVYSVIVQRLRSTIEQYGVCVRIRETGDSEGIGELLLSLAVDVQSVCPALTAADASLFLMHVCLSRLSVIISVVAIAVLNNTARSSDELIEIVSQFARELLSMDDKLTSALLESLSLTDLEGDSPESRSMTGMGKVHMGILRALFFFCGCTYESLSEASSEFYEIMTNLLYYVYVHHSDKACLTIDANLLLGKVLMQGVRGFFLASEKMSAVLLAVKGGHIELLRTTSDRLTAEDRKARSGMLTALIFYDEGRHYAGFPTVDFIPFSIARALEVERLNTDPNAMLHDLIAIADGIHQPEVLYWLLDALTKRSQEMGDLLQVLPDNAPLLLRLVAKLCDLATSCLPDDNKCELHWGLVGFVYLSVTGIMNRLGLSKFDAKEPVQELSPDVVSETFVYNVANAIYGMMKGNWCNMGVAVSYGDEFVSAYMSFLTLLFSTPPELVMARTPSRERVFEVLVGSISAHGSFGFEIEQALDAHMAWKPLLRYLLKCLKYSLVFGILLAIDAVLLSMRRLDADTGPFLDAEVVAEIFEEVVVHIVVTQSMGQHELELSFRLLSTCFRWHGPECTTRMNKLLDFCSAYHRVRLRHILTVLHSSIKDALASYALVFGRGASVQTLTAW